jgi:hypothetical protein
VSVAYITEKDVAKLVDALSAEQAKCRKLIETLRPFGKRGNSACAKYPEERAAYELLRSMGELE